MIIHSYIQCLYIAMRKIRIAKRIGKWSQRHLKREKLINSIIVINQFVIQFLAHNMSEALLKFYTLLREVKVANTQIAEAIPSHYVSSKTRRIQVHTIVRKGNVNAKEINYVLKQFRHDKASYKELKRQFENEMNILLE